MSRESDDAVIAQARKILKRRVRRNTVLSSPTKVKEWLQVELADYSHEIFHVTFLDSQHRIITHQEMFSGTIDGSAVYPRRVVEACILNKASALIFAHNHPSGVAEPSSADKRITERLTSALALVDIRVLDHFIVTGADSYSFAENSLL